MQGDFDVCHAGQPCRRQVMRGSESVAIVQRLEDLMRRCRDGHQLTYRDLLEVRESGTEPPAQVLHHPV
jgi:hypothetical protein